MKTLLQKGLGIIAVLVSLFGCSDDTVTPTPPNDVGGDSDGDTDLVTDSDVEEDARVDGDGGSSDADADAGTPDSDIGPDMDIVPDVGEPPEPFDTLSEYPFYALDDGGVLMPSDAAVLYAVVSPLFSDYAAKARYVVLPEGEGITYDDDAGWSFPVGSVLIKTFGYPDDLRDEDAPVDRIETRLLVLGPAGWVPNTYLWRDDHSDADLLVDGTTVVVTFTDRAGVERTIDYAVPPALDCFRCHGGTGLTRALGLHTRQLDFEVETDSGRVNQIDHFNDLGLFDEAPSPPAERTAFPAPTDDDADLNARARGYLDANCAHCHNDLGPPEFSGLQLGWQIESERLLGVCVNTAAGGAAGGREHTIEPGDADSSVMTYRMASEEFAVRMPLASVAGSLPDPVGVALISDWIDAMPAQDCE